MNLLKNPKLLLAFFIQRFFSRSLSDEVYLRWIYRLRMGEKLNLDSPKGYNEKCQWLKLYYKKPEFTMMADKIKVKQYVADLIGDDYVIPLLGVWDHFDEINFDTLPNSFVLKCNHDSGSVVLVRDKSKLDIDKVRDKLETALSQDPFYATREWPYKNIEKKILAEPFIESLGKQESIEYKISCMNGVVKFVTVCTGIAHAKYSERFNDHFTKNWEQLHWIVRYKSSGKTIARPNYMDKLIEMSEKLAKDIPFVRVDWYVDNEKIYFGELTFYTWAGFCPFEPKEWDLKLGEWINLPEKYNG